jgi:hypothetical protein
MIPRESRNKQTQPANQHPFPESEKLIRVMNALLPSINRRFAIILPEDSLETALSKCYELESSKPKNRFRPD